jgi:hypothetical protein
MNYEWKNEILGATAPQMLKGRSWGSGDATTSKVTDPELVKKAAIAAHWQDKDTWFRASLSHPWTKTSGYVALTEKERVAANDSYWITQEHLSGIWESSR